ncbi:tRNA pseudouridine synthase A-like [Zingiber officinale]|uniref:tRNA pseudouridine synthase A-like n=1 Tax=Zingiber officinale TaxID=94328 RepID=UPI001C4C0A91|nr:tRNA pseudouridine synthase A-like [Zingiber officinale]
MMDDSSDLCSATPSLNSSKEPKRPLDSPSESLKPPKQQRSEEEAGEGGDGMSHNSKAQRYLIAVEYIGTRFSGSQRQPNCRTVVGLLEEAFHKFIGQPVSVTCSSRTDAGVHALSNVCHVDVERISKRKPGEVLPPHEPSVVRRAMNHFLQKCEGDISIVDVRCVPSDFHARFKALERTYYYRLFSGPEPLSTFEKDRAWHISEDLDILAMKKACTILVGSHDFSSFRASGCQAKSPIKTLDELSITETFPSLHFPSLLERSQLESTDGCLIHSEKSGHGSPPSSLDITWVGLQGCNQGFGQKPRHRCYVIAARARSFLYHQVRLMVGVLKSVGTGELTISDVERILNAKTVTAASPMAPSCGLYLGNVKYDLP